MKPFPDSSCSATLSGVTKEEVQDVADRFCADLMKALTGHGDFFLATLAFVKNSGKNKRDVWIANPPAATSARSPISPASPCPRRGRSTAASLYSATWTTRATPSAYGTA